MSKKEIIYKSGIEEISKRGFFNTKVQDIVDNANVSVGTFYNYYKDKVDFLYYFYIKEYTIIFNIIKEITLEDISEVDMLVKFFDFMLEQITINKDAMKIIVAEKLYLPKIMDSESSKRIKDLEGSISKLLISIVSEGQKKKQIKDTDPKFSLLVFESFIVTHLLKNTNQSTELLKDDMKKFLLDSIAINGGDKNGDEHKQRSS